MPKSKRNKTVDLSKTKKHGLEGKKELYKKIQSNVENYAHVFVFAVNDMRNSKMKNVREQWKHSRFCIGKNKVMAMALGRTPEEEYRPNLYKIGQMLVGERGLLFTNQSADEVAKWFQSYSEGDYARSGNIATEDVILPEGPLAQFPHNLESYLRQLGLPTTLKKGVIHLIKEFVVCKEGDRLSPETARILKLLGYEMAEFRIRILSVWSQDGSFVNLQSDSYDPEFKENASSPQKSSKKEKKSLIEIEENSESIEILSRVVEDKPEPVKRNSKGNKEREADVNEIFEDNTLSKEIFSDKSENDVKFSSPKTHLETEDIEMEVEEIQESEITSPKKDSTVKKSSRKPRTVNKHAAKETEKSASPQKSFDLEEKKEPEQEKKSFLKAKENSEDCDSVEIISWNLEDKPEQVKQNSKGNKEKHSDINEILEDNTNSEEIFSDKSENVVKISSPKTHSEMDNAEMEVEEIQEPDVKKPKNDSTVKKSGRKSKKTVSKLAAEETEEETNDEMIKSEKVSTQEEIVDSAAVLKLTKKKLEESAEKPKKFSPKMTRARAAAANKKIKTPEPIETKRSSRKRKM